MNSSARGFTLIELMIVVVVIAIIAMFAYPAYLDYVRKGRRADAISYLLAIQIAQERYRAYNNQYAANIATLEAAKVLSPSSNKFYDFSISSVASSTYQLLAEPKTDSDQQKDTGCLNLTLDQSDIKAPASCWKR
ncbi:MAG: prepilin-type N-terminal cleavage/methylation domain-containing protein [Oceanospirillaceae bacterium]|nr:prepilin-type N-terminal cleavage/methylation domain-containing protein [Oceanospirillaceae bacterium]